MRKKLKEKRLKKGLTAQEMADKINVHVSYYYLIEAGDKTPLYEKMKLIGEILGVKPDYLFFDE